MCTIRCCVTMGLHLLVCVLKWKPLGVFQPSVFLTQYMCMRALKSAPTLISKLMHSFSHITLCAISAQHQKGTSDRGLFAIATGQPCVLALYLMEPRHHAKPPLELF